MTARLRSSFQVSFSALTLDAMALSLPRSDGFVYTTSSSMSPSFSPSITAQLSAPGISHSLLADITRREYLYSNLAERSPCEKGLAAAGETGVGHSNGDVNQHDRAAGGEDLSEERKRLGWREELVKSQLPWVSDSGGRTARWRFALIWTEWGRHNILTKDKMRKRN